MRLFEWFCFTGLAVLLVSYTWGENSRRLTGIPDNDIIMECLRNVAVIHKMKYRRVRELFFRGLVKKWQLDPYAKGAFAFGSPFHVNLSLNPSWIQSVLPLHFSSVIYKMIWRERRAAFTLPVSTLTFHMRGLTPLSRAVSAPLRNFTTNRTGPCSEDICISTLRLTIP